MSDLTIGISTRLEEDGFNSDIQQRADELKSAFKDFLPSDQIAELDRVLRGFSGKKEDIGDLRSSGADVFRGAREDKEREIERIKKEYESKIERVKTSGEGNAANRNRLVAGLSEEREKEIKSLQDPKMFDKAEKEWDRFIKTIEKSIGKTTENVHDTNSREVNKKVGLFNQVFSAVTSGDATTGASSLVRSGANFASDRIGTAVAGAEGAGTLMGLSGAAIGGIIAVAGIAIGYAVTKGYEQLRADKKFNAVIDEDLISKQGSPGQKYADIIDSNEDLGFNRDATRQMLLSVSRGRMTSVGAVDAVRQSAINQRGFGLEEGEANSFDKFYKSETNRKSSGDIILDILTRSEKTGILGVDNKDFSALPTVLKSVESIMSYQKNKADSFDSSLATALQAAGSQIGGAWGDDRSGQTITNMLEGLSNQSNPGFKAINLRLAQQAMPGATPYELETGIKESDPRVVLKQLEFARGIQGSGQSREMIERILDAQLGIHGSKLTNFIDKHGLDTMIEQLRTKPDGDTISKWREEATGRAGKAVTNLDQFWAGLEDYLKRIAESLAKITESFLFGGKETTGHNVEKDYKSVYDQSIKDGMDVTQAKAAAIENISRKTYKLGLGVNVTGLTPLKP